MTSTARADQVLLDLWPKGDREEKLSDLCRLWLVNSEFSNADDTALLVDLVEKGSQDAFRSLVERYLPVVYSAAVRQAGGDTHLARDIAQQVFIDFAKKAARISREAPLGGWLHRHTCYAASTILRGERRRRLRESRAIEMNTLQQTTETAETKWEELASLLDEAIDQLGSGDRTAIVLRFLEQRDFRSVGRALGTTDDAAQKRVGRALDKLRAYFGRRGVTLSAAGLGAALASEATAAIPAGLASSISTTALASAATASGLTLAALKIMTMTKLKIGIAAAVVAAGVATPVVLLQQSNDRLRAQIENLSQQIKTLEQLREENRTLAKLKVDAAEFERLKMEHGELMRL